MKPSLPHKTASRGISMPVMMSPGVVSPALGSAHRPSYTSYDPDTSPHVAVSLAVKRWRLVGLALVAIGTVAISMLMFRGGMKIASVELPVDPSANAKTQEKLLDQYNSYTGNAASALTKPIEVFTTMALQLVLLRFAARAVLQPENAWRVDKIAMVAAWAVLYLLLNGFNSLNVQLRPDRVVAAIRPSDLSVAVNASSNVTGLALVTNASFVVAENTPGNLVTNTVLRTAVVSRQWLNKDLTCDKLTGSGSRVLSKQVTDDGVEFGFPIRSWLGKLIPSAPPTDTLTIPLTAINATIDPTKLPMNSSRAAMLFLAAVYQSHDLLKWFSRANFNVTDAFLEAEKKAPQKKWEGDRARLAGVLPTHATGSETNEREWLLREVPRLLLQKFAETKTKDPVSSRAVSNDTENGLSLAFSHVELTPQIEFDAITFDAEVNLDKYTSVTTPDGKMRYHKWELMSQTCGPPPLFVCTVKKEIYGSDGAAFDYPSQVRAGAICVTKTGSESLESLYSGNQITNPAGIGCDGTSNTSMLVVSIAKRIVADAVIENTTNISQLKNFTYPVLVNARKIYSITVGRLGWKSTDLAKVFGAKCEAASSSKCLGLQFPLTSPSGSASNVNEVLVAGVDALPVTKLRRIDYGTSSEYTPLVILNEPQRGDAPIYDEDNIFGDVLLPHNLVNRTRDYVTLNTCDSWVGTRVNKLLTNHLYMEVGLQPAYTSALFWLFQDGAVRTVVKTSTASDATTLQFDGNVQVSSLVASIPDTNMWLSLVGCLVLVVAVVATVTYRGDFVEEGVERSSDQAEGTAPGQGVTTVSDPRVIAKVMLDEGRFPPMFLDRKIVDRSGRSVGITKMESFQIASMTLEGDNGNGAKQVCTAKNSVSNEV